MMTYRITEVEALEACRLWIRFTDGTSGEVDLNDRLFGPMFEPLKDPEIFAQVRIDDFGAVCWPNGADLAPDALHSKLATSAQTR